MQETFAPAIEIIPAQEVAPRSVASDFSSMLEDVPDDDTLSAQMAAEELLAQIRQEN